MAWRIPASGAAAVLTALALAPSALGAPHTPSPIPIEVRVPIAPAPVNVGGATKLFYEFHLASYAQSDMTLDELEILNGETGAVLNDFKGAALDPLLRRPGVTAPLASPHRMAGGTIAIVYIETTLAAGATAPKSLRWRLRASKATPSTGAKSLDENPPVEGEIRIEPSPPVVIGFPLGRGDWVAGNGPSNTSGHRRTVLPVDGAARISQRFAIDWVKLGPDGQLFHGDKAINANWYGFGEPILAVADATVSDAHDGVPENEPSDKRAVPITLDTVGGNYLILDLGAGRYAFYAHMQPGSQKVHVGDKVRLGQVLGLLGNTGNSDAPHLHFHVANANSPLGAEGLPYVFSAYQALGAADLDSLMGSRGWKGDPKTPASRRRAELPPENAVIRIP